MEPALAIALLWLVFGGTHVGLATRRIRAVLLARLGEWGFMGLFSLVAAAAFTLLVHTYALQRFEGAPGLALGAVPALRPPLVAAVVIGVVLIAGSLVAYPRSPYALFNEAVREPYGIERVTRHGFFVGVALLGLAHALLATRLVGAVFAGSLGLFALAGAWHQDRKLLGLRGAPYAHYLATTSTIPFAAILAGRQRLVWHELPWVALASGVALAVALRAGHDALFAHGGAWVIGTVLAGAALETLQSWRRGRRRSDRAPSHLAPRPT